MSPTGKTNCRYTSGPVRHFANISSLAAWSLAEAEKYFKKASSINRDGSPIARLIRADTLGQLSACLRREGKEDEARSVWRQAESVFNDCLSSPETSEFHYDQVTNMALAFGYHYASWHDCNGLRRCVKALEERGAKAKADILMPYLRSICKSNADRDSQ